jgi:hypothetical protein
MMGADGATTMTGTAGWISCWQNLQILFKITGPEGCDLSG